MIAVLNLGRCDYGTALCLQQTLVELRQQDRIANVLLFVEHPPVITLGRNARQANIIAPRELLASRGVEVHEINRGGDVTVHAPGQLVAYPIFDLRSFSPKLGVIHYVRLLEEVLMRICAQYTIETRRIPGMTGVWTYPTIPPRLNGRPMGRDYIPSSQQEAAETDVEADVSETMAGGPHPPAVGECGEISTDGSAAFTPAEENAEQPTWPERKIAAIGVHIARGVTSHGFALNVTTALDLFQFIVPCGLAKPVTSIEFETGLRPSLDEVMTIASRNFGELFGSQMLWLESIHDLIPQGSGKAESPKPAPPEPTPPEPGDTAQPSDTPARAPRNERRIAGDDIHLA